MSIPTQCNVLMNIAIGSEEMWSNVTGVLDLETFNLSCSVIANPDQQLKILRQDPISLVKLSVQYNDMLYNVILQKNDAYLTYKSKYIFNGTDEQTINFRFSFLRSELKLKKTAIEKKQQLFFIGMRKNGISTEVEYSGKKICIRGDKHDDILLVDSEMPLTKDIERLIYMTFSIYQNGKLTLHIKHDNEIMFLYPVKREIHGIDVHFDIFPFNVLWSWLLKENLYKKWMYCIEFFFAGMQKSGSYIDFRLMNLFVFINAVISINRPHGEKEKFGSEIAQLLDIDEGDGFWLAYVRNALVHDGAAIPHAIEKANDEFLKKQTKQGKKLVRYKNFELPTEHPNDRAFLLYCDIMDLTEAFIMRSAGYTDKWLEIKKRFGLTI